MTTEEAIKQVKESLYMCYSRKDLDALIAVVSAAEKLEVMDWMHDDGFADDYSFGYVMEHMQDFIDAYRKAKEGE
jgi:hypothetical protein